MRYDDRQQPGPVPNYGPQQPVYYKPKKSRLGWILFAVFGAALLGCGLLTVAVFGQSSGGGEGEPLVLPVTGAEPSRSVPATKTPRKTPSPPVQITEGGYIVGEDLPPGVYRSPGAREEVLTLCMWEVRPGGNPDDPIDFKRMGSTTKENSQVIVRLEDGDFFKTTGCQRWTKR